MKKITFFFLILLPFILFLAGYAGAYLFFEKSHVVVPSLLGKTVKDGALLLGQRGLFLAILKEQEDPFLQDGTIVHQLPLPGQHSKFQKPVYVTVIKKLEAKKTPAFFGLHREEIEELARKTKMQVSITKLPVNYSRGVCFAQTPIAGELSQDGQVLIYMAENNQRLCMIPDVCGLVFDEAAALLTKAGIGYEIFNAQDAGELILPEHKIIDQRPRSGVFVDALKSMQIQLQVE